ncbi:hypothetical protein EKM01_05070 [Flavobacterium sp. RSP46]|uniref:FISUMP domain-containing protein n=1 Tax=Flavobacterium sp. RSP46 TaxID=2497486 RepID=UPI000F85C2C2|nr:FISUMP domain-containing protein [Flavobacterium sp. RSP46]RTY91996.1 hypothetical protein EKM01_05070 [Flavobacterium sp. RSP46]RTY96493.1 hypothetical protein EKL32_00030 [Flavobacterium sp. GSN2]
MYNKQLKKIALLLIIGSFAVTSSAQEGLVTLLKIGENPYTINDKAALEVESTTKGFLLPRMTKQQRDAIATTPPVGLQVWCLDCDGTTVPASGQLCVYMGTYWAPIKLVVPSCSLTTGNISSASNSPAPVRVSATSATISGKLEEVSSNLPTETGIVWKEIIGTDFASLPFLDALGAATVPVYKTQGSTVTTVATVFSVNIPTLTSTTSNKSPYYFRTYAKTAAGIEYGNPIVFSCDAYPVMSDPVVTRGTTANPTFAGTLTVNAGTPQSSITEYGYYSGGTSSPITNKVVLGFGTSFAALNADAFTANPKLNIAVNNYVNSGGGTVFFRFYAVVSGTPVYSSTVSIALEANAICDGTASTFFLPVTSPTTAKIWMDRNLGASRVATAINDNYAYGCLYQWGRGNDGHASIAWTSSTAGTASATTTTVATTDTPGNASFILSSDDWVSPLNNNLWQGISGVNNPCPSEYRIPTSAEFTAETAITNSTTAYSSVFKLPAPGGRMSSSGSLYNTSSNGIYRTSTSTASTSGGGITAYFLNIASGSAVLQANGGRAYGYSVRCIKN